MSDPKTDLTQLQQTRILARLNHLDQDTLQQYVEEKIADTAEFEWIEAHLFDCEECLEKYNLAFDAHSPYKTGFDAFRAKMEPAVLNSERARLVTALERLSSVYGEWKERLLGWRDHLLEKEAQDGASLSAFLLPEGQESYVKVLRFLSAPDLDVAFESGARGFHGRGQEAADTGGDVVITAGNWLDVAVKIEADSVMLEFMEWTDAAAPLVVLLPDEGDGEGLLPDHVVPGAAGEFGVRFEHVPPGSYLLSIAPAIIPL